MVVDSGNMSAALKLTAASVSPAEIAETRNRAVRRTIEK
jgi:hypothetical protein